MSGRSKAGFGGIGVIVIAIIIWLAGGDPTQFFDAMESDLGQQQVYQPPSEHENQLAQFIAVVLADTEDVWDSIFRAGGSSYPQPKLVLFNNQVQSACGYTSAATGPFYCPGDTRVYIDLGFLEQLQQRLDAGGDFAQAYIVAHEVGHHVQNLLGILEEVHQYRGQVSEEEYNDLSVKLELQADFLAGVWAHHADRMKGILEEGDIEEAFNAAKAVGDDRIQMKTQGYVVPDAFTHGSSQQRMHWFMKGYRTGDIGQGDTFGSPEL